MASERNRGRYNIFPTHYEDGNIEERGEPTGGDAGISSG